MQTILRDLKLIMFGALILLIDFNILKNNNNVGLRIDLINDFIGALMVLYATARMSKIEMINISYTKNMRFVKLAAVFLVLISLHDFLLYDEPPFIIVIKKFASIIIGIGVMLFFVSMIILAKEKSLKNSVRRMKRTKNSILWICLLPVLLLEIFCWNVYESVESQLEFWVGTYVFKIFIIIYIIAVFLTIFHGLLMIQKMREELRRIYKL